MTFSSKDEKAIPDLQIVGPKAVAISPVSSRPLCLDLGSQVSLPFLVYAEDGHTASVGD
jgi:hypothetical protein